jgi:RNA recognition motif-containing protein
MRGQAHVVFRDIQTATQAMRALQGFELFGMEMQIQYAKTKSDIIRKLRNEFVKPAAAAGEVVASELQQSIFNAPPSAAFGKAAEGTGAGSAAVGTLKPPPAGSLQPPAKDETMRDKSPASAVGEKRKRDEDDEGSEEDDSDVAMEEDSDDED